MSAVSLYKVTNVSAGPRGIHTAHGPRYLQAGDEWVGKVSEVEAAGALSTGYFTVELVPGQEVEGEGGDDRASQIALIIADLPEDKYTAEGAPMVDAINEALAEGVEHVTAAERDAIWASLNE
ncbi:MAG: hypothetical protein AAGG56_18840 [Pseudomonadota bacterium]